MADAPSEAVSALKAAANKAGEQLNADLLIFNYELWPPVDFMLIREVANRRQKRRNVILFLTTEGGSPDAAFRIMRCLQSKYDRVTVVVSGWCKSAGTLMCIGAHELLIGEFGEMGPLDVQIVKADEMDEQKSGLVAEAAFDKLQDEAFKFFIGFVRRLGASEYRVTLRTATDVATKMTIGVVQPIFDKLDPVTIGEDYRSNRLATAYAERLNTESKNLRRERDFDALKNLLSGYPSHGFAIDFKEASELFKNVKPLPADIVDVVRHLGPDAVMPRNQRNEQNPRLEFLNDEQPQPAKAAGDGAAGNPSTKPAARPSKRGNGTGKLPGNPSQRGRARRPASANGA